MPPWTRSCSNPAPWSKPAVSYCASPTPEIEQQVKDAKRDLDNRLTNLRQLQLNQKRELLAHQASLESLKAELEIAELKVEAERQLVSKGIVSELDFKRSTLQQRQLTRRVAIEQQRLAQLAEVHTEVLAIAREKIQQQREQVEVINERFAKLTVRAGINGVVQNLPVELGQSVAFGEQVALVGSVDELYAMLQVSQSEIEQIALAQQVDIDTRGGAIVGEVTRISPLVTEGSVAVEVALKGPLPSNARPELSIDAVIDTGTLTDVVYLAKPVNAAPGSRGSLFRLAADQASAERVEIRYGRETRQFIQILSGAEPGDSFILSDMSRWQDTSAITIH